MKRLILGLVALLAFGFAANAAPGGAPECRTQSILVGLQYEGAAAKVVRVAGMYHNDDRSFTSFDSNYQPYVARYDMGQFEYITSYDNGCSRYKYRVSYCPRESFHSCVALRDEVNICPVRAPDGAVTQWATRFDSVPRPTDRYQVMTAIWAQDEKTLAIPLCRKGQ